MLEAVEIARRELRGSLADALSALALASRCAEPDRAGRVIEHAARLSAESLRALEAFEIAREASREGGADLLAHVRSRLDARVVAETSEPGAYHLDADGRVLGDVVANLAAGCAAIAADGAAARCRLTSHDEMVRLVVVQRTRMPAARLLALTGCSRVVSIQKQAVAPGAWRTLAAFLRVLEMGGRTKTRALHGKALVVRIDLPRARRARAEAS
jgi:hypothetical protein